MIDILHRQKKLYAQLDTEFDLSWGTVAESAKCRSYLAFITSAGKFAYSFF